MGDFMRQNQPEIFALKRFRQIAKEDVVIDRKCQRSESAIGSGALWREVQTNLPEPFAEALFEPHPVLRVDRTGRAHDCRVHDLSNGHSNSALLKQWRLRRPRPSKPRNAALLLNSFCQRQLSRSRV